MKWIKINYKKLIGFTLICLICCYTLFYGFKQATNQNIFTKPTVETKIYSVWHIETFEGGGKSRILYLKNIANFIESNNPGVLFNIRQIQPENLKNELINSTPDIVSFGYGLGKILLPYLTTQEKTFNVRDNLIESGMFTNKLYAIPFIISGYALISHNTENSKTIYGGNKYTNASKFDDSAVEYPSQYEAYKEFVNNKKVNLIGTARDVFRVNNLNKIGRTNATISALTDYTDLIQFVATTRNDDAINSFLDSLFNENNQLDLVSYSLFSPLHTKLYTNGIYNEMENAILNAKVPNLFYD